MTTPETLAILRYGLRLLEARLHQKPHAQRLTPVELAALCERVNVWDEVIKLLEAGRDIPRHLWPEASFMERWAQLELAMTSGEMTHDQLLAECKQLHEERRET